MATAKHSLPLWRVWARTPRVKGTVSILVRAATREIAAAIINDGATVTRCTEVRS
jgi:hypothetical protein